jgi:putative DNA primase/helicase
MPEVAPPVWDNIPPELARMQQWLLWKFDTPKRGSVKPAKVPYYVLGGRRTGDQGGDRDRARLATLDVVRRAYEHGRWAGIGFAFLPGDGLIGIDIDGAIDTESGEVSGLCLETIRSCDSYTEYSVSGKGVHIIVQGTTERSQKSDAIGLEVYCGGQFFIFTGRRWPNVSPAVRPIAEEVLGRLHETIAAAKEAARQAKQPQAAAPRADPRNGPASTGDDDFARVNAEALRAYGLWVQQLIPQARPYRGGYRATSKDLGRDLQEDLSIHPDGIRDFGLDRAYTPIDLVMQWLPAPKPRDALAWLAARLNITLSKPALRVVPKAPLKNVSAPAGGAADAGAAPGGAGGGEPPPTDDGGAGSGEFEEPPLFLHRGKPVDCRENVLYCLRADPALKGLAQLNTFTELHERTRATPWGRKAGEWDEEDDLMLGEYLAREWQLLVKASSTLRNGVLMAAREHKFNPIIDLIKSQEWDGTPRLDHWLTDVFEVQERRYTQLIGRCLIMGMVMRAMRPGCKFDYMLILKGEQGLSKSGAFRVLAEPWFTDNAIKMGDKDSLMAMQLVWIAESAELESLNKAETTLVKQFLSAQEDMYRPPYGAQIKKRPRHSVVVGSTNADTMLKDATGDRRFWPLEVEVVHLDVLRNIRLQLFAEALHRLRAKEQYWPTREQEKELVFPEQARFKKEERWEDYLDAYVNCQVNDNRDTAMDLPCCNRDFFTSVELYDKALNIKADRIDGAGQMDTRIANAMKSLGFTKHRESTVGRRRGWLRNPPPPPDLSGHTLGEPPPGALVTADGGDDDLPF